MGPTSFNGAITLACSAGPTCAFSTNPIFVGGTNTTMTVSNLTTNPLQSLYLYGDGDQRFAVHIAPDESGIRGLYATAIPTSDTIQAGTTAKYNVIIHPLSWI